MWFHFGGIKMTLSAKREYVKQMQFIYRNASGKKEKTRLIRQISETLGCHKKHAGRLMRGAKPLREGTRRHRKPVYTECLIRVLKETWRIKRKAVFFMKFYELSSKNSYNFPFPISPSRVPNIPVSKHTCHPS
ncbi:MAG: hypothetical protein L6420_04065 [Elusimicrobia bacterium]|nr:hypothetical protein [Elusimicrobiota bacterium]